ncbi:OadG family protein [Anaerocolumna sp. AGMB13020]|uniref:OadG family protein n=1 Tax=Anaerocolumna sp. AGMB13020 TaxID=3081750 RepID=UPI00295332B4|nr:OadG family protein [Anaerocolumna sp. AGMB13020]WOO36917.1 OadG family protein [Anaerocolumna sp. AGMB13020]
MSLSGFYGNSLILAVVNSFGVKNQIPGEYLDTVVILGLVFTGLILVVGILGIIRLFIALTKAMYKNSDNSGTNRAADSTSGAAAINKSNPLQINPADDPQLVAVITAALMASLEEVPADGLVIRSIRRR